MLPSTSSRGNSPLPFIQAGSPHGTVPDEIFVTVLPTVTCCSPQPTHRPASRASKNTNPKISTRITRNLGSENVFAMSVSPF